MKPTLNRNETKAQGLHILVIDDDPVFRATILKAAKGKEVAVTVVSSLNEVEPQSVPMSFDIVVLDYYLDNMKENLTGTDVASVLEATPILLTSASDHALNENVAWPTSIRKFVDKKKGANAVLNEAIQIAKRNEDFVEI